jgi:hypothetical protein
VLVGRTDWPWVDSHERAESTSQAEYAGSIPVIGSTSTSGDGGEPLFARQVGTYPVPTARRAPPPPLTPDSYDTGEAEPSRSAESETTVSTGRTFPTSVTAPV